MGATYSWDHFSLEEGDNGTLQLFCRGERRDELTFPALRSLHLLVAHQGRIVSNAELRAQVGANVVPNTIEGHISDIRKVLARDAIGTVRKQGYRFLLRVTCVVTKANAAATLALIGPMAWMETDHSQDRIELSTPSVEDQVWCRDAAVPWRVLEGAHFELVGAGSETQNFRAEARNGEVFLLRRHVRPKTSQALLNLQGLMIHVADELIFELSHCLRPIPTTNGELSSELKGQLIELFPYADNVQYFGGRSDQELESTAHGFGQLLRVLENYPSQGVFARAESIWRSWADRQPDLFAFVKRGVELSCDGNPKDPFLATLFQHLPRVEEASELLAKPAPSREAALTLTETHAQNVFCRDARCVLIFDYSPIERSVLRLDPLAFGLHRFVRERVRRGSDVRSALRTFLAGFQNGYGPMADADLEEIPDAIRRVNVRKLLRIASYRLGVLRDPMARNNEVLYPELVKFIAHLMEADEIAKVLRA